MKVPVLDVQGANAAFSHDIASAVSEVVLRGDYILGLTVSAFEDGIRARLGTDYALGVNSGTDALFLVLKALGVGPDDEVITVPNTFVATVAAARNTGATVRLVDVGDDENMDPEAFSEAITTRTRAVIAVHLRGRPAQMAKLNEIARAHSIDVIEDASQAFGAELAGRPVGTLGRAACFSLHPQKILGACGDAGLITTNDPGLASQISLLRNQGLVDRDTVARWGFNSRLDSIQAAILMHKLQRADVIISNHRRAAARYHEGLRDLPLQLPLERTNETCVYYHYSVMSDSRDGLLRHLMANGVEARIHYPKLIHQQPAAAADKRVVVGTLSCAEQQVGRQLSLPIFEHISPQQIDYVISCVRSYFSNP